MQPQLFVHKEEPNESLFEAPKNDQFNKPQGGLWTSTLEDGTSAWIEWVRTEGFYNSDVIDSWCCYPESDIEVYRITSEHDYRKLAEDYSYMCWLGREEPVKSIEKDVPESTLATHLDFEAIAEDYDAIHLTEQGQTETRFTRDVTQHGLYGWDCESTLWLRMAFEKIEFHRQVEV